MGSAQRHTPVVTHLSRQSVWLCVSNMVSLRGLTANQTGKTPQSFEICFRTVSHRRSLEVVEVVEGEQVSE